MNKLVACAVLSLGLTQVLVACGDDDASDDDGTSGSSSTAGKGGSASGGTGGKASGGSGGSKAGSGGGGNTNGGGTDSGGAAGENNGVGGDPAVGGAGGDTGAGGNDNMGGAGGAPPVEPEISTEFWLAEFCAAKSIEELECEFSPEWSLCYNPLRPFVQTIGEGLCAGEEAGPTYTKTEALMAALNLAANACQAPDASQWRCDIGGQPQAKEDACREADEAIAAAWAACGL
jgi:hypothetical protein